MVTRVLALLRVSDNKSKTGFSGKDYLFRLLTAACFLIVSGYCNVVCSVIAAYRTPNMRIMNTAGTEMLSQRVLPDMGHFFMDYIQQYMDQTTAHHWENIDPNFFIAHIIHAFVVLLLIHPQRLMLARRCCGIVGYIFLSRSICVLVTSMPDSQPLCYKQFGTPEGAYKDMPIFPDVFWTAFSTLCKFSDSVTCGDMIFSGHMVMITLGCLFFAKYCNTRDMASSIIQYLPSSFCLFFRCFIYLFGALGTVAIIKSRLHYTIDVVLALYFSLNSWNVYHRTARDIFNNVDTAGSRLFEYSPFNKYFGYLEAPEMQIQDALVWEAWKRAKNDTSGDCYGADDKSPLIDKDKFEL